MNLYAKLQQRAAQGKPVRVGLIGAGKFGSMYLAQVPRTPGVHLVGIADLNPAGDMPVSHNTYAFESTDGGTRATFVSVYDSAEGLQQVLAMGVEEGATTAINQIDAFLAAQ